jgi:glucose-6-phosphate 1-dehydrogenase
MRGDATLFTRNDEVEAQWRVIDPVLQAWAEGKPPLDTYAAGSQGPAAAARIMEPGDTWRAI